MNASDWPTRGRARIGVVVPVSNTNLEPDMMMLAPRGVSFHFVRTGGYDVDAIPDEAQMRQYSDTPMDEAVDGLRICRSDLVLYGCTSATLAQGPAYDEAYRQRIEERVGVPAVTAAGALVAALAALGVERYAFSSPYVTSLNDLAIAFIGAYGPRCVGRADAPEPLSNEAIADLTPEQVTALALKADREEAEAVVLSCTDLRAAEAVPEIERCLGKPVVTSNQAMLLAGLRRLGTPLDGSPLRNQLLSEHWPAEPAGPARQAAASR